MRNRPKLVIFDVDGTLVDSQNAIVGAMTSAFSIHDVPTPTRPEILSIVGLSLDHAMYRLAPDQPSETIDGLVSAYKAAYQENRLSDTDYAPLYPGASQALGEIFQRRNWLLGIATGKSTRGLSMLLDSHNLQQHFITKQTADDHPSKPHPSMILTAMAEAGTEAADTVMIGDTSYDMDMARAAGVTGIGVSWGYHEPDRLGADFLVPEFDALPAMLERIWET